MTTLTINIEDQSAEKSVKAFLDKLGLKYSIDKQSSSNPWWEDQAIIEKLDDRSNALKSGTDKGFSFSEIKQDLLGR
ncbi:hypothetical protein LPB86_05470 [Pedobacter sp. MC2016-14]|uniref:hypothetical protein n=1 Tax=Pedobacter sp. MC2016-14 TaxID=2897327 RepID=UPI001E644E76|nr:hypothetical protein [Pedobacter sp. MC2016-14]MCD0487667.1 hypothetical protein [Pedobacter sp. MC2016-14]